MGGLQALWNSFEKLPDRGQCNRDFRQLCGPLSFLRLPNKLKHGTYPVQRQEIQEPSLSEV